MSSEIVPVVESAANGDPIPENIPADFLAQPGLETPLVEEKVNSCPAKQENKSLFDPSVLPQSSDPQEILAQVEFYFSDSNLPNDKFLWGLTQENDGWVPIATIASFKRMRRFQPVDAIPEALKQSENLLQVNEDGTKVRRKTPLVRQVGSAAFDRSIYIKGFAEETTTMQIDLENFFKELGTVNQIRMRRDDDKKFKGSIFVEFGDVETAKKVLAMEEKPKWNDCELVYMSKKAYVDMKAAEYGGKFPERKKKFNAFKEMGRNKSNGKGRNGPEKDGESAVKGDDKKRKHENGDGPRKRGRGRGRGRGKGRNTD